MGIDDVLSRLIDRAYAAALDDRLWDTWSVNMAEAFGCRASVFHVMELPSGILRYSHINHSYRRVIEDYRAEMHFAEPQNANLVASLPQSCTYLDTDHVDYSHRPTADFMAWLKATAKVAHHMTGIVFLNDGSVAAGLSMHRGVDDGPTPREQRPKFDAIFPEVVRAMQLGFVHSEKLNDAFWDGGSNASDQAAALIDERGRVVQSTLLSMPTCLPPMALRSWRSGSSPASLRTMSDSND